MGTARRDIETQPAREYKSWPQEHSVDAQYHCLDGAEALCVYETSPFAACSHFLLPSGLPAVREMTAVIRAVVASAARTMYVVM